jgi:hypothetical protein
MQEPVDLLSILGESIGRCRGPDRPAGGTLSGWSRPTDPVAMMSRKISRVRESTLFGRAVPSSIYWTSALQDTRSREFALELIRDKQVAVAPGSASGDDHVRILSLAAEPTALHEGCQRIASHPAPPTVCAEPMKLRVTGAARSRAGGRGPRIRQMYDAPR